jgi:hypothetical protein
MPFEIDLKASLDAKILELTNQPDGPGKAELLEALQEAWDALHAVCTNHADIFEGMHAEFPAAN